MRKPLWTSGTELCARLGNGLRHEGLGLVSAGQLHQHNLVGDLCRRHRQALFKL